MDRPTVLYPSIVLLVGLAVWANCLQNDFTSSDLALRETIGQLDSPGEAVTAPYGATGSSSRLYRPVTTLSLLANRWLTGDSPTGYRAVNLLLHLLNGSMVFWLAWRLLNSPDAALVAALVFILHPVQTETINTLAGRADLMALFWMLLAWLFYQRALLSGSASGGRTYAVAVLAAFLAHLSKETTVLFVPVLAACDLFLSLRAGRRYSLRSFLKAFGPGFTLFVLVALLSLVLRHAATGWFFPTFAPTLVENPIAHTGLVAAFLTSVEVVGRYGMLLLLPVALAPDYGFDAISPTTRILDAGWLLTVICGGFCLFAIRQSFRRNWSPEWGMSLAVSSILLLPSTHLFFIAPSILTERALYFPALGFCLLVAVASREVSASRLKAVVPAVVVSLLLLLCGFGSANRNPVWSSSLALYTDAVQAMPRSARAHLELGKALRSEGKTREAVEEFSETLQIHPHYADVHYELGVTYQSAGRLEQARMAYGAALQSDSLNVGSWMNLGTLLGRQGRLLDAAEAFGRAMALAPDDVDVRYNFALSNQNLGRGEQAVEAYLWVLDRVPDHVDAAINVGALYTDMGFDAETIAVFRRFLNTSPEAYQVAHNLGVLLEKANRLGEAARRFEQASGDDGEMGAYSLYRAGVLYQRLNQDGKAGERLSNFLERWTGSARVRKEAQLLLDGLKR